jgi:pimeloyl-ACP methyl ester carboxylesterase
MGGTVGLHYLSLGGARVGRLVLVNSPVRLTRTPDFPYALPQETLDAYLDDLVRRWPLRERAFVADSLVEPVPELVDWLFQIALQTPVEVALRLVRAQAKLDLRDAVRALPVPVLAAYGRHDPYWPPELADWIAAEAPRGERIVFEASAHCIPLEEGDRFCAALEGFAAGIGNHEGGT